MGSWGAGLWDSDTALDIKNEYARCLRYSYDDDDVLKRFMRSNEQILADSDDGPVAVMVLAQQMWKYGRLTEDMKKMAFEAAENDLKNWEAGDNALYIKRKRQLEKYTHDLDLPQPEPRKVKRTAPFENHWVKGDVSAIKYRGRCMIRERDGSEPRIYSGGHILLMFDGMKNEYPVFYTMLAPADRVYKGMDIFGFPYIQYFERSGADGEMVYRAELQIHGADQQKKMMFLGNYSQQPPVNDDKEMTCIIPFDIFAPYAVNSYFSVNKRFEEVKEQYG